MTNYRIFYVNTAKSKPGKSNAAAKWWGAYGISSFGALPGVKSVQAFASQFCFAGTFNIEIWQELESYAVLDKWDEEAVANPDHYEKFLSDFDDLFERGPSRLMGDWPESRLMGQKG